LAYNDAMDSSHEEKLEMNQEAAYRKQASVTLSDSLKQLEQFLAISEDDFLVIGGKLQNYQSLCNKINTLSQNIIQKIDTEILSAGINKLDSLFSSIGTHFTQATETIEKDKKDLQFIYSRLSDVEDSLNGFDKIVKTLRMLGISSKIESARLNLMDGGFFLLAETVDKMGTLIGERKNAIKSKSKSLLVQLAKSLRDLTGLAGDQEKQSTIFNRSTTASLESFKEKNMICASSIGEIKIVGTKLTEYLRNIVGAIQFHDITRQQLQHVGEVVEEMIHKLNEAGTEGSDLYSHIHDNTELQARQLSGTLENFTNSIFSIIESLREVETGTHQLFSESKKIIGIDTTQSDLHQALFESDLRFITEGLQESLLIDKNLDASIAEIVSIVSELAKQIDSIEEIGTEIELVALNARVKAAHLGIEGAALGVLAEAIQKLSIEAKTQTGKTFEVLMSIDKLSGELRNELTSTRHQTTSNLLQTTVEDLNLLLASIKKVENSALVETKELDGIVKLFESELQVTVQNIQIHSTAEELLVPVINGFNGITTDLKSRYNIESRRAQNTQNIIGRYTMMSEREIHTQYTNTSSDFNNQVTPTETGSDDLDNNIELF